PSGTAHRRQGHKTDARRRIRQGTGRRRVVVPHGQMGDLIKKSKQMIDFGNGSAMTHQSAVGAGVMFGMRNNNQSLHSISVLYGFTISFQSWDFAHCLAPSLNLA